MFSPPRYVCESAVRRIRRLLFAVALTNGYAQLLNPITRQITLGPTVSKNPLQLADLTASGVSFPLTGLCGCRSPISTISEAALLTRSGNVNFERRTRYVPKRSVKNLIEVSGSVSRCDSAHRTDTTGCVAIVLRHECCAGPTCLVLPVRSSYPLNLA